MRCADSHSLGTPGAKRSAASESKRVDLNCQDSKWIDVQIDIGASSGANRVRMLDVIAPVGLKPFCQNERRKEKRDTWWGIMSAMPQNQKAPATSRELGAGAFSGRG